MDSITVQYQVRGGRGRGDGELGRGRRGGRGGQGRGGEEKGEARGGDRRGEEKGGGGWNTYKWQFQQKKF